MKKPILFLLSLVSLLTLLSGCSLQYNTPAKEMKGMYFYESSNGKKCFVTGPWEWDGDTENTEIWIPDTFEGYKVVSLGGYYGRGAPCSFGIKYNSKPATDAAFFTYLEDELPQPYILEEYDFTLHIGKYVSEIAHPTKADFMAYHRYFDEDGNQYFIKTYVYVECDPKNKTFYSQDGKLYRREDDSLVDSFFYR